jgi:hypothetical protein
VRCLRTARGRRRMSRRWRRHQPAPARFRWSGGEQSDKGDNGGAAGWTKVDVNLASTTHKIQHPPWHRVCWVHIWEAGAEGFPAGIVSKTYFVPIWMPSLQPAFEREDCEPLWGQWESKWQVGSLWGF